LGFLYSLEGDYIWTIPVEDKGTAEYLTYLCKENLRFGKDLALFPPNYTFPLVYGLYVHDPKIMMASMLMGLSAVAYWKVHELIHGPNKGGFYD
jgi:hypothetical protein